MQPFRNVDVWRKGHELTLKIFQISEAFPKAETFGLSIQLRRSAMTIPMKIAEGCGHDDRMEFLRCLRNARAAAVELEYLLLVGRDLRFIEEGLYGALQDQLIEVRKMLSGLMKSLEMQPV